MAYVICTPSAATAIKSYSPELMVLPYLPETPVELHDTGEAAVDQARQGRRYLCVSATHME